MNTFNSTEFKALEIFLSTMKTLLIKKLYLGYIWERFQYAHNIVNSAEHGR